MKFSYEYRTSDNARHTGVVVAPDREAAFRSLKSRGIKPGRLVEAPGFFNKFFGKGKRWLAIGVLAVILLAVLTMVGADHRAARNRARFAFEDRAQLFGDPSVIQKLSRDGWRETFPDAGEAWLARHAIPGKVCDCAVGSAPRADRIATSLLARKDMPLAILDTDSEELKKMKRMVNGMKREFASYVQPSTSNLQPTSSDAIDYINKACERVRIEKGVYDSIARELAGLERQLEKPEADRDKILAAWDKKNAALRAMGLSTIPQPE